MSDQNSNHVSHRDDGELPVTGQAHATKKRCLSISTKKISRWAGIISSILNKCTGLPQSPGVTEVVDLVSQVAKEVADVLTTEVDDDDPSNLQEIYKVLHDGSEPIYSSFPLSLCSSVGPISDIGSGFLFSRTRGTTHTETYKLDGSEKKVTLNINGSGKLANCDGGKLWVRQSTLRGGSSDNVVWVFNLVDPNEVIDFDLSYGLIRKKIVNLCPR